MIHNYAYVYRQESTTLTTINITQNQALLETYFVTQMNDEQ